jgi:rsbT antagonist protein RsbS
MHPNPLSIPEGTVSVPILKQGNYLIASIQSALSDTEVVELRNDLVEQVGSLRARGVVVDVAGLDVIDSFVARSLQTISVTVKLRGADTVIVGIQPDVAMAMIHFQLNFQPLRTALDLEEGLAMLDAGLD